MFLAVRSLARAPQRTFQTRHCSTGVSGVNKVILVGTVEGAPRVYTFDNDKHTGEEKKFTEWHRVLVRNNQSLVDMTIVHIEGRLKSRKYTDKTNTIRSITEVVVSKPGELGVIRSGSGNNGEGDIDDDLF